MRRCRRRNRARIRITFTRCSRPGRQQLWWHSPSPPNLLREQGLNYTLIFWIFNDSGMGFMKFRRRAPRIRCRRIHKWGRKRGCSWPVLHLFGKKAAIIAGLEQGMRAAFRQRHLYAQRKMFSLWTQKRSHANFRMAHHSSIKHAQHAAHIVCVSLLHTHTLSSVSHHTRLMFCQAYLASLSGLRCIISYHRQLIGLVPVDDEESCVWRVLTVL